MKEKLWTRSYATAVIIMFGLYMVASILLSVMAIYAKNLTGLDAYAGIMTSVFALGALAVRFLAGGLIERFSSKKVILVGIGIMIIGSLLLLNCNHIIQALIARGMQGVGFGLSSTATSTYIAIMCHPTRLLEGISYTAVAMSLTAVIGPSIGFWIIGPEYDRFTALFFVAIGIAFIALLFMAFEKGDGSEGSKEQSADVEKQNIQWRLLVMPIAILFINALTQSAIVSFLALFAISLNFVGVGSFFSINAAGMIASRFIMNKLVERYGEFTMIMINTLIFAASVFLLAQVQNVIHMLLLAFPAGFAMGSIGPIINTYLIQTMPRKGLANALFFSALDIGYGVGSIGWGIIAMSMGYAQVFYLAAFIQIVAVVLSFIQNRRLKFKYFFKKC